MKPSFICIIYKTDRLSKNNNINKYGGDDVIEVIKHI